MEISLKGEVKEAGILGGVTFDIVPSDFEARLRTYVEKKGTVTIQGCAADLKTNISKVSRHLANLTYLGILKMELVPQHGSPPKKIFTYLDQNVP